MVWPQPPARVHRKHLGVRIMMIMTVYIFRLTRLTQCAYLKDCSNSFNLSLFGDFCEMSCSNKLTYPKTKSVVVLILLYYDVQLDNDNATISVIL